MGKKALDTKQVRKDLEKMSVEEFAKTHTIEQVKELSKQIHDEKLEGRISKAFMLMRSLHH